MNSVSYAPHLVGSQTPRVLHLPVSEPSLDRDGRAVVELAAMAGLHLDPWQATFIEQSAAKRAETVWNPFTGKNEHKWAAREVGLMISRQNGKGSILEARELAGLFLFGERLIIHSAHQFDTSVEAFNRILMLIEQTPDLDREVKRVSRSHGEEGVELLSGQRLRFRTRTKGGGRGFTGDCLILDEAMYLDKEMIAALMPTLSARPNVQIWYTGSAGNKNSTQFGRVRSRALKCQHNGCPCVDEKLLYAEWSAELCNMFCNADCNEHDRPDDPRTWAKANAAYGIRLGDEACLSEFKAMDPDMFAQERLGVGDWPTENDSWAVIPEEPWKRRGDSGSLLTGQIVLAVDTSPDRGMSCIVAAGANTKGDIHVEITSGEADYDYHYGQQWVVNRVKHIWDAHKPAAVAIDTASPAGALILELEALGIKVVSPTTREFAQSCGDFLAGVAPRKGETATITHMDQPPLTAAAATADRRQLQDLWAWSKQASSSDISPLVAATLAAWAYKQEVHQKKATAPWVFSA